MTADCCARLWEHTRAHRRLRIEALPEPPDLGLLTAALGADECCWFDSARMMPEIGRWSFVAAAPRWRWRWQQGAAWLDFIAESAGTAARGPFTHPRELLAACEAALPEPIDAPGPFVGGLAGVLSYDLGRWVERVPARAAEPYPVPELSLAFYRSGVLVDHEEGRAWAFALEHEREPDAAPWARVQAALAALVRRGGTPLPPPGPSPQPSPRGRGGTSLPARERMISSRNWSHSALRTPHSATPSANIGVICGGSEETGTGTGTGRELRTPHSALRTPHSEIPPPRWSLSDEDYAARVAAAKELIAAGEVYQVNVTRTLAVPAPGLDTLGLYRRLRRANPAPMAAYVPLAGGAVLSSSPERLCRITRGTGGPVAGGTRREIETRPIKGTRPRFADCARDAEAARELSASAKDRAELAMIVDLARNDLGRLCEFGSVTVRDFPRLESYETVHHLVGVVAGRLRPGVPLDEVLWALFPGGSITGAPKVRALAAIEDLEPWRRGVYTGSLGYRSVTGDSDWNIAIRTLCWADDALTVGLGAGIVADSDPAAELAETRDKGRAIAALLAAAGLLDGPP